jgi:RNA polymerase sigma-70 factor, ECF subfamily
VVDLAETVSAAQGGCNEAFSTIVRETYDDTYSLALRLVGNADDANDVVQDTYLRAFRAIRRFRGDANIATWLYRITANTANTLLKRRSKTTHLELVRDSNLLDDCTERNPEERAESSDMRSQILGALASLPAKLRSVVVLRDIYDLSHDAIAEHLGISEAAAKVRLHRARQKLRETIFRDSVLATETLATGTLATGTLATGTLATETLATETLATETLATKGLVVAPTRVARQQSKRGPRTANPSEAVPVTRAGPQSCEQLTPRNKPSKSLNNSERSTTNAPTAA